MRRVTFNGATAIFVLLAGLVSVPSVAAATGTANHAVRTNDTAPTLDSSGNYLPQAHTANNVLSSEVISAKLTSSLLPGASVKAFDTANIIPSAQWFKDRYAEGFRLYAMHATEWGTCRPWMNTPKYLQWALDAGIKIAIYTRDPRCWSGGIDAAGSLASRLQFFALDVETNPGVRVTQAMVDGVRARGIRPIIYSGFGMWSKVMGGNVTTFSGVPLWDTNVQNVNLGTWTPNTEAPTPVSFGDWNTPTNPRAIVQQAFEIRIAGVNVDINSVRADFLR
jgi:hypothetical protein